MSSHSESAVLSQGHVGSVGISCGRTEGREHGVPIVWRVLHRFAGGGVEKKLLAGSKKETPPQRCLSFEQVREERSTKGWGQPVQIFEDTKQQGGKGWTGVGYVCVEGWVGKSLQRMTVHATHISLRHHWPPPNHNGTLTRQRDPNLAL